MGNSTSTGFGSAALFVLSVVGGGMFVVICCYAVANKLKKVKNQNEQASERFSFDDGIDLAFPVHAGEEVSMGTDDRLELRTADEATQGSTVVADEFQV